MIDFERNLPDLRKLEQALWYYKYISFEASSNNGTKRHPITFLPIIWVHIGTNNPPKWHLGAAWGVPEASLEDFRSVLGAFGKILKGIGGASGAFGTVQEPCLTPGAAYRKTGP